MVLVRVKKNIFFGPLRMPPTPPPPPPPLSISFSLSHCPVLFPSPSSLCFVMDHFLSSNKFPFLPPSNFKHQMKCHWCQYMGYNTITHTHTHIPPPQTQTPGPPHALCINRAELPSYEKFPSSSLCIINCSHILSLYVVNRYLSTHLPTSDFVSRWSIIKEQLSSGACCGGADGAEIMKTALGLQ